MSEDAGDSLLSSIPLTAAGVEIHSPDGLIGEMGFGLRRDDEYMRALASRLVLCWNACRGFTIEELGSIVAQGGSEPILSTVKKLAGEIRHLQNFYREHKDYCR